MLFADKQNDDTNQQNQIFRERLPRSKVPEIAKTTAFSHLVEIGRIKSKEGKEYDHQ